MRIHRQPWFSALALLAAPIVAQEFALRDAMRERLAMVASDAARQRLVALGRHGDTRELVGNQWLVRPGRGPGFPGGLIHRGAARRTLAFGTGADQLAQTWEYDGIGWSRLQPAVQPSPRDRFALAYDWWRDRVVVFGGLGTNGAGMLGDTWEWDGTTWHQHAGPGPGARFDPVMTFDFGRGVTVLFGGTLVATSSAVDDTWEWDGIGWQQRTLPAPRPSPRSFAGLAYDLQRAQCVLYGGLNSNALGDLWEYDGARWLAVSFAGGPGPRTGHQLLYDFARGEVVLVGGADASVGAGEVHSWNGVRWQQVATAQLVPPVWPGGLAVGDPIGGGALLFGATLGAQTWRFDRGPWTALPYVAPAPGPRTGHALWSDGGSAWMFGGDNGFLGAVYDDTWRWNGLQWQPIQSASRPSPRAGAAVAFDAVRQRAVLFGGGQALADTWTFDGATWQQQAPATVPTGRQAHALAFDPQRARVVMFGGEDAARRRRNDTFEWDGTDWTAVFSVQQPPAFGNPAMAFDARLGRVLMTHSPPHPRAMPTAVEAWTWDGANWAPMPLATTALLAGRHSLVTMNGSPNVVLVEPGGVHELLLRTAAIDTVGAPCDATAPRLAARMRPELGEAGFGVEVLVGVPQSFVAVAAASSAARTQLGGCTLELAPPHNLVLLATGSGGLATLPVPIPTAPALVGTAVWFQAAALQPVLPAGITLSAALRAVVGG